MRYPLEIAQNYLERPDATAEQLWYVYQHLGLFPAERQKLLAEMNQTFLHHALRDETAPQALVEALTLHRVAWVATGARQHVALVGEAGDGWEEALLIDWTTRLWRDGYLVWLMRAGALPRVINQRLPYPLEPEPFLAPEERRKVLREIAKQRGNSLATVLATAQTDIASRTLTTNPHWERRLALALNPNGAWGEKWAVRDGHRWVRAVARQRLADPMWRLF